MADFYSTRVAGTSFRQQAVRTLTVGAPCRLVPEDDNEADPNAVRVEAGLGLLIGYIPRDGCEAIRAALAAGLKIDAKVRSMQRAGGNIGVIIEIVI